LQIIIDIKMSKMFHANMYMSTSNGMFRLAFKNKFLFQIKRNISSFCDDGFGL
jgi:hypothetical protein